MNKKKKTQTSVAFILITWKLNELTCTDLDRVESLWTTHLCWSFRAWLILLLSRSAVANTLASPDESNSEWWTVGWLSVVYFFLIVVFKVTKHTWGLSPSCVTVSRKSLCFIGRPGWVTGQEVVRGGDREQRGLDVNECSTSDDSSEHGYSHKVIRGFAWRFQGSEGKVGTQWINRCCGTWQPPFYATTMFSLNIFYDAGVEVQ